ncbi:MAG: efflux RND transporter permease subunit [Treponema sp.]|nr:efflux RND transporter permease subunit [Treponema sp.]
MKNVASYSVNHPVTITILYALIIGIAFTMLPNLSLDLFPSTEMPVLSVWTSFPGAGPDDVERNVTERIERTLASSQGLVNMTSFSSFESSSINLQFAYGTDMDKAMTDAQNAMNRIANSLPAGAGTPIVRRFGTTAAPVIRLIVRGSFPPDQLRLFAEDEIQARIERITGVASAEVTGGTTQQVNVKVALNRLAAFDMTLNDVITALRGQNIVASGGSLRRGTMEYQIITQEELLSIEQIRRLVVRTISTPVAGQANRSQVVRLEDIADVDIGYNENAARVHVNGQSGVYIQVTAEADGNQVLVANRIIDALDEINAQLPRGITLEVLSNNTTMITATLNQVYMNAFHGIVLAMLILFLFLRNIKGTVIIGLAIPISILLTVMFMAVFGFSLNLMTLTGLIMGMGMTADASIVILENVYSYRKRGAKPNIAAILGSREMIRPIVASTATTLCVFIPLIIYRNQLEMMGQMFNDLIFTVVISLICSLVVAVTLVPSLGGSIMKIDTRIQKPLKNRVLHLLDQGIERALLSTERAYQRALRYCLSQRLLIIILVLALLVVSLFQATDIGLNMFFRSRIDDNVNINVSLPQGTTIDVTERLLFELEEIIRDNIEGYNNIILTARRGGTTQGSIQITLPEPARQIDTPDSIIRKLSPIFDEIPEAVVSFRAGRAMGSSSAVEIAISSRNLIAIRETADEIVRIISRHIPEIEDPRVNIEEGAPQLIIQIDRDRAAALGVSMSAITSEIRTAMDGTTATTMSTGDRLMDVRVMLRDEDREGMPNLDAIFVMGRGGSRISLSNVATVAEGRAPSSIRRERQERVVRITGDLPAGIAVTDMQSHLEAVVREYLIPHEGVTVRYLGEAQEIQAYSRHFILIVATAIFLIFGVMASQFESFVDPFIIFFSIPMLFIGVIWIYRIGNESMSMFSMVGIVALIGVVVNAGIILVDYTNTLRARGFSVHEACLEAGRSRLRPVLMTAFTTILAMTPIAFFPGIGAETIQPIGKTFVGGLAVSTFMTLFLIPVLYSLLNSRHDKKLGNIPNPETRV